MPLGNNFRLSTIKCPSGSGPKVTRIGWAGNTLVINKNKVALVERSSVWKGIYGVSSSLKLRFLFSNQSAHDEGS